MDTGDEHFQKDGPSHFGFMKKPTYHVYLQLLVTTDCYTPVSVSFSTTYIIYRVLDDIVNRTRFRNRRKFSLLGKLNPMKRNNLEQTGNLPQQCRGKTTRRDYNMKQSAKRVADGLVDGSAIQILNIESAHHSNSATIKMNLEQKLDSILIRVQKRTSWKIVEFSSWTLVRF